MVYDSIDEFIQSAMSRADRSKIPTGLIITGPSIAASSPMFDYLRTRLNESHPNGAISLRSEEASNLKTLLKTLISKFTKDLSQHDEDEISSTKKGPRRLNYDLEILHDWYQQSKLDRLVVMIQQTETFDSSVLAEAVELFDSWSDRIPFVLLFDIGTSVEFFHERLPRTAIRCLEGQKFDVAQADEMLERVFIATTRDVDIERTIWPGSSLCDVILDWHKQHTQSVDSYSEALKYAYMAHFFANPLSAYLAPECGLEHGRLELDQALKNLPSFRIHIENLLEEGQLDLVQKLLESEDVLHQYIPQKLAAGQDGIKNLIQAVDRIYHIREQLSLSPSLPWSDIYIRAMAGGLSGSALLRDLLLTIRKVSSDVLLRLLEETFELTEEPTSDDLLQEHFLFKEIHENLQSLLSRTGSAQGPLRSAHDVRGDTMRATVVAQKVQLSKQKSELSEEDAAYSKIMEDFHQKLTDYFNERLIDPKTLFLSELLIYDLKSPHREAFIPRPRQAVERALSAPQDYLSCDCCPSSHGHKGDVTGITPTQNPTSILYQLYLESGTLINATDLWTAFNDILGETNDEKTNMALFERALAELRFTGCIKGSRKKTDHVSKLLWKGL
jgi:origin recognition complex subunit 3